MKDHLLYTNCHSNVWGFSDVCFQQSPHGTSYFIKAPCVPAMSIYDCQNDSLSLELTDKVIEYLTHPHNQSSCCDVYSCRETSNLSTVCVNCKNHFHFYPLCINL